MRAALALAGLFLLALPCAAQDVFRDPDFGFEMTLPPGLRQVDAKGRAAIFGIDEAAAANTPRGQDPDGKVAHAWVWIDAATPYNRQVSLRLADEPPPFRDKDGFVAALRGSGLTIESDEMLPPPVLAVKVVGTFTRPDGVLMRKVSLLLPDAGAGRHGPLNIQAFANDWQIVSADLEALVQSVRMTRAKPPGSEDAGAGPGRGAGSPTGPGGRKEAPPDPGDWGALEVVGSFVVAGLGLAHLLLTKRAIA